MSYTLEAFISESRAALEQDSGPAGRNAVKLLVQKAALDAEFLAKHVPLDQKEEKHILYQHPELGFCILGHVYNGPKESSPHDHGPSWAIYGQASGVTQMTDYEAVEKPQDGQPGKAAAIRTYSLTPGDAHVYNEGDLHAPSRAGATRLIRIEGINLTGVRRDKYDVVESIKLSAPSYPHS